MSLLCVDFIQKGGEVSRVSLRERSARAKLERCQVLFAKHTRSSLFIRISRSHFEWWACFARHNAKSLWENRQRKSAQCLASDGSDKFKWAIDESQNDFHNRCLWGGKKKNLLAGAGQSLDNTLIELLVSLSAFSLGSESMHAKNKKQLAREPVDAQCISQARKFSFQLGFIIFAELLILLDGIMLICRFFSFCFKCLASKRH